MKMTDFMFILLVPFFMPNDAHAYLDPGTGSVILQVVAAGVLGALFTIKSYWRAMVGFITGRGKKANDTEAK
ncbi:MAG: hypothetical protein K1X79_01845 [Oligoflexia bacterium]|nr:hypothetical protein [Oligoflexia bacterium]